MFQLRCEMPIASQEVALQGMEDAVPLSVWPCNRRCSASVCLAYRHGMGQTCRGAADVSDQVRVAVYIFSNYGVHAAPPHLPRSCSSRGDMNLHCP